MQFVIKEMYIKITNFCSRRSRKKKYATYTLKRFNPTQTQKTYNYSNRFRYNFLR